MRYAKLLIAGLLTVGLSASAKADGDGLALAYLFGYGGFNNARVSSFAPSPPYFALHPPVYYGQRYTRPYGASPFAAWPQLQGNAAYAPSKHVERAVIIDNPHALPASATSTSSSVVANEPMRPLVIENPYFEAAESARQAKVQYTVK